MRRINDLWNVSVNFENSLPQITFYDDVHVLTTMTLPNLGSTSLAPLDGMLEANYQRYARPDLPQSLEISSSILRASLIQDSLKYESEVSSLESSVLLDVSKAYLSEDFVYSLCVLLALKR
ncbi:neuroblastoma-amplified sequence, partial [Caerostris extrusa]